jgi:quercetin dioxygenase-like cupin family protein
MDTKDGFIEALLHGKVGCACAENDIEGLPWNAHPKFAGVFLKHLVTGKDTQGRFSAHIVRVDPGHAIGDHAHATEIELHEVVGGSGRCLLDGKEIAYRPGVFVVVPQAAAHVVEAGDDGLLLLAKFAPALC